jgi:hypothetical protein
MSGRRFSNGTRWPVPDALVNLRLLCDRRDGLTAQRTQAVRQLYRLLAELTPGGMRSCSLSIGLLAMIGAMVAMSSGPGDGVA